MYYILRFLHGSFSVIDAEIPCSLPCLRPENRPFMLRWIRLFCFVAHTSCYVGHVFYFLAHTSCYVGYVFFTSLHIRQGTLDTSSLLRCTYFMLRWIRLLYFVAHTSSYVGYVFSTSLHIRQGTLDTSSLLPCTSFMLRWTRLLYFLAHPSQRGSPKVLAHTGTLDSCWKACKKKMLPSSLRSQSPIIRTCVKAWQWRYVHRNQHVCNITAKTVSKLG